MGGPELRKLTYAQRAELLGKIADALAARRDEWFEIARKNSGNTKADASIDVDGSIGTLKYFAKIGGKLGDARMLRDGAPMRLARDANFQGLHVGVPLDGVAVHINAFNFPGMGLVGKGRSQPAGGRSGVREAGDFDGVAGAGDGERSDRGRHSSAGSALDSCAARRMICSIICGSAMWWRSPARPIPAKEFVSTSEFASRTCA